MCVLITYLRFLDYLVHFDDWLDANCSKAVEGKIWSQIQSKDKDYIDKYIKIWRKIRELVLAKNFNEETLVISGRTMRHVIQRTAQFGIHNFLALQTECTHFWTFHNSFFFAGTGNYIDHES
jgi:hypothetical protein